MKITKQLSDEAILAEVGARITHHRLRLHLTQVKLAELAGVGKRTLERVEAGASTQMVSVVRIFRVLELLSSLDIAIPEAQAGPMDLLKLKGKTRRRASAKKDSDQPNDTWQWGDES
ncbi:helix-turn-helix domain-containing protein [Mariprofundus sp. EBB-1]|uniref:helix-turn-helix domain-containing protein n=1 Tax=Mariprofundus sp. EBB-1 TaxID=2650971 RepID=UPI000EF275EE|nr:helix-turn-helix domain-containing protein [Mariprofundus sp. EBB-1]RLL51175.1 helix-turn-helix domain-containing protein [Mariprofundus sp. EBB-1]